MLKRSITFEDFNGDQATDVFYFNISKPELVEMEVEYDNKGFATFIQRIIDTKDNKILIKLFKEIVLKAYGVKSEDGKRFIKSEELRLEFSQTAAYNALFMELATNDGAAVDFLKGALPRDMSPEIDKAMATDAHILESIKPPNPNPNV